MKESIIGDSLSFYIVVSFQIEALTLMFKSEMSHGTGYQWDRLRVPGVEFYGQIDEVGNGPMGCG